MEEHVERLRWIYGIRALKTDLYSIWDFISQHKSIDSEPSMISKAVGLSLFNHLTTLGVINEIGYKMDINYLQYKGDVINAIEQNEVNNEEIETALLKVSEFINNYYQLN